MVYIQLENMGNYVNLNLIGIRLTFTINSSYGFH